MSLTQIARALRRNQTKEEKELWQAGHVLDFYCADAKLAIELDDFQHGSPEGVQRDAMREKLLAEQGVDTLRFWNHQWRKNRDGCLLEIWNIVQRRTGCVQVAMDAANQRFVPPDLNTIKTNPSS